MLSIRSFVLPLLALAASVRAQQPAWAQCGGQDWTGGTTCISGYVCTYSSVWFSQCIPGTAATPTTATQPSSPTTSTGSSGGSGLWWFGVNLSGAEWGTKIPGVYGVDYIWYSKSAIDTLIGQGVNLFRVNFLMERLTPNSLTASFDTNYLNNLTDIVAYITSKGAYAMVQPHNYGRFNNNIITDTAGFQAWWKKVAALFKSNSMVVFDTNNEYHDMDQTLVVNLNQAAINGIRAAGATSQYITPEGNSWTGAWTWVSSGNGATLGALTDPSDSTGSKLIFQMHQYLNSDGSGSTADCVSSTVFQERLQAATAWLKSNHRRGFIGEYSSGYDSVCITALQKGLQYLKQNNDVWVGSAWWAAGPWWGTITYSMEPPSGVSYTNVFPKIKSYAAA